MILSFLKFDFYMNKSLLKIGNINLLLLLLITSKSSFEFAANTKEQKTTGKNVRGFLKFELL